MLITRKLGKVLRGSASPSQLMMAALLGAAAGFMPGFFQAPGLLILMFLLVLLLNANLTLIALTMSFCKAFSILLMPLSFRVGQFLVDGPTQELFAWMINAPVLALFGFEYYTTTGGLVVGLIIGALIGWGTVSAVCAFRRKMASLEKESEGYRVFISKWWVKAFLYIFAGSGLGKTTYEEALSKKGGNPIRPLGLVFAAGVICILFAISMLASDLVVRSTIRSALERANGASVDLEEAQLSLRKGRLTLTGLAMADANALNTDIFRAAVIEADIDHADLLRKRLHIERIRVLEATMGEPRRLPGVRNRPPEKTIVERKPGERTLDDYLRQAQLWRERIAQAREWLDRISGEDLPEDPVEIRETRRQRIEREILEQGYANMRADHLIRGAPTLLISRLMAEGMRVAQLEGETVDVVAENISTHPGLIEQPASFEIRSSGDTLFARADLGAHAAAPGNNRLEFRYLRLPVDSFARGLNFQDRPPLSGGSMDVRINGGWTRDNIDLPLEVTLRDTSLALQGIGETSVEELVLPLGVRGPWADPRIEFENRSLADALAAAGKAEVARRVRAETERLQQQAEERVGTEIRERARDILGDRLPILPTIPGLPGRQRGGESQ